MGFTPERTVYKLNFEGTHLDGLLVRMGSLTVAEYNKMMALGQASTVAEAMEANQWIADLFLAKLIEWNLEDKDHNPVPATQEGLDTQERPVINAIITAWQGAMINIPAPLPSASENGGTSEELSLGLGGQSQNL